MPILIGQIGELLGAASQWELVQHVDNSVAQLSFPRENTAGNVLFCMATKSGTGIGKPTDTAGNSWIPAGPEVLSNGGLNSLRAWIAPNCKASAKNAVTASTAFAVSIAEWSGCQLTSSIDSTGSISNATCVSGQMSCSLAATTVPGDLIIAFGGDLTGNITASAPFQETTFNPAQPAGLWGYWVQPTTGSVLCFMSSSVASDAYAMSVFSLKHKSYKY